VDFVHELGALALVSRMKRLVERMHQDNLRVFKERGIPFEVRWFLVLNLLNRHDTIGIMDLANALHIKHPSVIQLVNELSRQGYAKTSTPKTDRRVRLVALTPKGRVLLSELTPIWQDMQRAAEELISDCGVDMIAALKRMEEALDEKSYYHRIQTHLRAETP
jgi:MarR family transcriptional regulator, repressor for mepA